MHLAVKVFFLTFVAGLLPFLVAISVTIVTSNDEERLHAQRAGNRSTSPACKACRLMTTSINKMLKEQPLPPVDGATLQRMADRGKGLDALLEPAEDETDSGTQQGTTSKQAKRNQKFSEKRRERATQILQRLCTSSSKASFADYCTRILRKQRKDILAHIFNITRPDGGETARMMCEPYCESFFSIFDYVGFLALRFVSDPIIRRIAKDCAELWGPVLVLSVVGGLLGMSLHLRVLISHQQVALATVTGGVKSSSSGRNGTTASETGSRATSASDGGRGKKGK